MLLECPFLWLPNQNLDSLIHYWKTVDILLHCGKNISQGFLQISPSFYPFSLLPLSLKTFCICFRKNNNNKLDLHLTKGNFTYLKSWNGGWPFVCMGCWKCCLETLCYQREPNIRLEKFPDSRFVMIICNGKFQGLFQVLLSFLDLLASPSPLSFHFLVYLIFLLTVWVHCLLKWKTFP